MNVFITTLENKKNLKEEIASLLSREDIKRAESDWHAKRRPRHCGLTIHTGVGCPYQCVYCYVYSMGFPRRISKYPIPPITIIYALLSNPYFVPGINGTFLAIGSVTEPFHPLITDFTIELLHLIRKYLKNPTQASTKATITSDTSIKIRDSNPNISILYTFTTLSYYKILEPYAPTPEKRLESIKNLVKYNVHTTLFVRPIIPGITDKENTELLEAVAEKGVKQVLYGSLRLNRQIYKRLEESLEPRLLRLINERIRYRIDNRQRYIYSIDIKKNLVNEAKKYGYKVFPSACSANIDSMKQSCYMCNYGPCGDPSNLPVVTEGDILEFMEYLSIARGNISINIRDNGIKIFDDRLKQYPHVIELIKTLARRRVTIY